MYSGKQRELVLRAIHDLNFAQLKLRMTHVIVVWDGVSFAGVEGDANKSLQQLKQLAENYQMQDVSSQILSGPISNQLLDDLDKHQGDLLALGSYLKTPIEGIFEGSVGRKAIIHCRKSVLIAKESYEAGKDLSVVLATDHSPAAHRWIDQFIAWAPRGLRRIHLVTAIPEKMLQALACMHGIREYP